uniref:Xylose isomerase domain-containing protein TIM barrel n=2 Tax=Rubinisphaera brasiliensis TaxID=119 RepID=F0SN66_RUBBR|nr:Xylose isomerase domain-containing protein TIM barrel [Rubinisphaera brasiliensis DSM 5305]
MPNRLSANAFSNDANASFPDESDKAEPAGERPSPVAVNLLERLSLSQMTTKRWAIEQELWACRRLGLRHIGLWRLKCEDLGEDNVAALLCEHGLTASSISWIGGFTCPNGYLLRDTLEESEEVIQFASWVGASNVVVATGEQGRHILSHATRLAVSSLRRLGDLAGEKGVHLAVMPMTPSTAHGWTFLHSLRKCQDLLELCDHPHVGLCLNSYHLLQKRNWRQELTEAIDHVKLIRLCDGPTTKRPRKQCLPLDGRMPLLSLVEHLERSGYSGLYEIDTWNDDVWQTEDLAPFQRSIDALASHFRPE